MSKEKIMMTITIPPDIGTFNPIMEGSNNKQIKQVRNRQVDSFCSPTFSAIPVKPEMSMMLNIPKNEPNNGTISGMILKTIRMFRIKAMKVPMMRILDFLSFTVDDMVLLLIRYFPRLRISIMH